MTDVADQSRPTGKVEAVAPSGPSPTLQAAPAAIGRSMPMALSIGVGIALAAVASWLFGSLAWFILLFYFSFTLATIMEVPVHYLHHKLHLPRGLVAGALMVLALAVIGGLLYLGVIGLYNESKDLANNLKGAPDKINAWVDNFSRHHPEFGSPAGLIAPESMPATAPASAAATVPATAKGQFDVKAEVKHLLNGGQVGSAVGIVLAHTPSVLEVLTYLVLTFFMTLYMSIDGARYVRDIRRMLPRTARLDSSAVFESMCRAHRGWFVANVVNVASASILSSIGLWIVGTPAAILLGIFAGFGEIVPNIGPPIAAVPAVLITLLNDPAKTPWVILMFVIVQTIQGYGLSPLVMKHNVELPPLATILAVLGMGTLFGFLGVLVAVPLTADLVVIWNYVNRSLEKRLKQQDNDVTNDPPAEVRESPPHRPGR